MSAPFVVGTLSFLLLLTSLFMILLVLIQRGRGGGLAGAFGGQGGQSAFGTRAGDVFTKITVVVAIVFILLASLLGKSMRAAQENADREIGTSFIGGAQADTDESNSEDAAAPSMEATDFDSGAATTSDGESAAESEDLPNLESDDATRAAETTEADAVLSSDAGSADSSNEDTDSE
ncbi:MAG: preprotein translocase subunit SecG [Fuerstiella sp.]|nr:preprotein translocase subunit SecG [Fuerstiella sp.]